MNAPALRALAADAYHQVVDNSVFRILAVLTLVPILAAFTVGVRPDGIEVLYGLRSWTYAELFGGLELPVPADPQGTVIQFVLGQLLFEFFAGSLGMLLAISATAFFVPRMLEKGTAELYFHKPISREWLLASRYFAGLVFVALVGGVLVVGLWAGLTLVSGWRDAGILAAAFELVYAFALVYSFSILCGVVTRSTVASILLSSFFFMFNGCIHQTWIVAAQADAGAMLDLERSDRRADDDAATADGAAAAASGGEREDESENDDDDEPGGAWRILRTTLDVLHYTLPKTTDASAFGRKLRKALAPPEYRDDEALVTVLRLDPELERAGERELTALDPGEDLRATLGDARYAARSAEPPATHSLWRRAAKKSETRFGERVRVREESSSQAAEALEDLLTARGARDVSRESGRFGADSGRSSLSGSLVAWRDDAGTHRARVFKGSGEWIFTLLLDAPAEIAPEELEALERRLVSQLALDLASLEDWYPNQLGLSAPLRFNVLFSVGSSLAFAAAMFALAALRLRRIAF